MNLSTLKHKLHEKCVSLVAEKLQTLDQSMRELQASANGETKSSAGDKYETGRAMVMLEKEKLAGQWEEANKMSQFLSQLSPEQSTTEVQAGAMIRSGKMTYYLSVSMGKVVVDSTDVFVISPVSPIGQAMLGKEQGDTVSFNGRSIALDEVV
ncbi:MAG: GreA/GreB family elongation factor [Cyclobacteriaceae bacterium]